MTNDTKWRTEPRASDANAIREIVTSTGFFHDFEVDVAVELVEERLSRGQASGYHFLFLAEEETPTAYACFGPNSCTEGSWDLYWIAVHATRRGQGLGKAILREVEARVTKAGGRVLWIETSSRAIYEPTRAFYLASGCTEAARMKNFYAVGDDKVVYMREMTQS